MIPSRNAAKRSSQIIVCGQSVAIDWDHVFNFRDNPDFDATQQRCFLGPDEQPTERILPFKPAPGVGMLGRRYALRNLMHGTMTRDRLQQIIRQFVLHHDGLFNAHQCFHVLHDERGLSVHFIVDSDGAIYQTLDLAYCAFHATGLNATSVGVEICNRGEVIASEEHAYDKSIARGQQQIRIHGERHKMWDFTEPQYQAMTALGQALTRLFANLPPLYPDDGKGRQIETAISEPKEFSGFLGHYHITQDKWDPGCFDFVRLAQAISGRPSWFLMPAADSLAIADDPARVGEQERLLLENVRNEAMGGYFPVGPCGDALVWHGGVHFSQPRGAPMYCPFAGRVVAARFDYTTPIGSCDFVLTQHRLRIAGESVLFYMLFFHLDLAEPPPWLQRVQKRPSWVRPRDAEIIFPDAPLSGGEVLGGVGLAGPPGRWEGQVHVEVMAPEEVSGRLEAGFFRVVRPAPGPYCTEPEVLKPIAESRRSATASVASTLREFFQHDPRSDEVNRLAIYSQSEWRAGSEVERQLLSSPAFRRLPNARDILQQQIRPTQWWTDEVAQRTGLPADGLVWHYHPVVFVGWLQALLRKRLPTASAQDGGLHKATDGLAGDTGYIDDEDRMTQEGGELDLASLVEGWPDPPAPPPIPAAGCGRRP